MKYLLDASALLAVLRSERGAERVATLFGESGIGAANLAEVVARLTDSASTDHEISEAVGGLTIATLPVDVADGFAAGFLRPLTKHVGLSLGDRLCLAMARRRDLIVLTSDRAFKAVETVVGVEIEVIR